MHALEIVVTLAFLTAVLLALIIWGRIYSRCRASQEIVPYEPREQPSILALQCGTMLVVILLLVRLLTLLSQAPAEPQQPPSVEGMVQSLQANAIFGAVMMAFLLALLKLGSGASWQNLGWSARHARGDLRLGVTAYLAIFLPIFAIQALLSQWYPTQHLIVRLLQENPDWRIFVLSFIAAVVIAPISEEVMFRFSLQGWLQHYLGGTRETLSAPFEYETEPSAEPSAHRGWLPILISSLIFALVHLGNGPDPIPLFFLALVLGYLYRQTGRLLPSIVVHVCLNATSLAMLGLGTLMGEPAGG